jgi:hypothetical protein
MEYTFCIFVEDLTACISFSNHPLVANETIEMRTVVVQHVIAGSMV